VSNDQVTFRTLNLNSVRRTDIEKVKFTKIQFGKINIFQFAELTGKGQC